jgi:hypothetical protein
MAERSFRRSVPALLTLVVLACTGAVLVRENRAAGGYEALHRSYGPQAHALLVVTFQERDCENNLEFLTVLERPEFRERVGVLALFSGSSREFGAAAARLESRYPHVRFERLDSGERRLLSQLGHRATPYWVMLDATGAVRLSAPAPPDPLAYRTFAESLRLSLVPTGRT